MRISDWSSDVCSSDLVPALGDSALQGMVSGIVVEKEQIGPNRYIASLGVLFDRARTGQLLGVRASAVRSPPLLVDRKSVVSGKSVSVSVDLGGRRCIKQKRSQTQNIKHKIIKK